MKANVGLQSLGAFLVLAAAAVAADEQAKARPALGITLSDSSRGGVRIVSVYANSPASDADLKPGDQILAVNHEPVARIADVMRLIAQGKINERTSISVRRDDLEGTVHPKLRDASEVFSTRATTTFTAPAAPESPRSDFESMPYQG